MNRSGSVPLYLACLMGMVSLSAEPRWTLVRPPGGGCWPPRCAQDQLPLATPVVSHAGRLLMIGDGAAPNHGYESADGINWRGFTHDAGWGRRYKAADASYGGALWRVGGWIEQNGQRIATNDVWRSEDGRHWERVLEHAPWSARSGAALLSFRDTLWLIGGDSSDHRLWLTTDGRHWMPRLTSELPDKNPQGILVFRDALWIIGRGRWNSASNDVWTSVTGSSWTRVTANAQWSARTGAGFAVLGDRLWIVGGIGHRDSWSSSDGRSWRRAAAELPGPPRSVAYSVVFRDAFWVFGGKTGGAGGTGFWDGVAVLQ